MKEKQPQPRLAFTLDLVNETRGYRTYTSDRPEVQDPDVTTGDIYRSCLREYGRPTSKIYIDRPDASSVAVGWTFAKRVQYDDCPETFLQTTWITVLHQAPNPRSPQPVWEYYDIGR
jgi:hypothetical protein